MIRTGLFSLQDSHSCSSTSSPFSYFIITKGTFILVRHGPIHQVHSRFFHLLAFCVVRRQVHHMVRNTSLSRAVCCTLHFAYGPSSHDRSSVVSLTSRPSPAEVIRTRGFRSATCDVRVATTGLRNVVANAWVCKYICDTDARVCSGKKDTRGRWRIDTDDRLRRPTCHDDCARPSLKRGDCPWSLDASTDAKRGADG